MYDFMFTDYTGGSWPVSKEVRCVTSSRAALFTRAVIASILDIWAPASFSRVRQQSNNLTMQLVDGSTVAVTPSSVRLDASPSHATMRATMRHIAQEWGGTAMLAVDGSLSREERLLAHAYAQAYNIDLDDQNQGFRPLAFTSAESACLPAMVAEIRAQDPDAPPTRPAGTRPASRLYPFRVPQAA